MVAIVMTDDGPEVDLLDGVPVHPAAEMLPVMPEQEFEALVADIAVHGLRELVVLTPDGWLLDGRSRWRACAKLGGEPACRVETGDPWAYALTSDRFRRLTESQRALAVARAAARASRVVGGDRRSPGWRDRPPPADPEQLLTQAQLARTAGVSVSSVSRARCVLREATLALQAAVEAGHVPVFTALRAARALPPDLQDALVEQVRDGADPAQLVATLSARPRASSSTAPARIDNRSPDRHQYVTAAALRSLSNSLDALRLVLGSTNGLDPALTPEEAARWLDDLSKGRRALYGVVKLLTQRKESTQ